MTLPTGSVMHTIVLLNVLRIWACPWAMFLRSLRRTFLAPVRLLGGICFLFERSSVRRADYSGLLLPGLLLAGHRLLPALPGAGIGLRPLAMDRQSPAVT